MQECIPTASKCTVLMSFHSVYSNEVNVRKHLPIILVIVLIFCAISAGVYTSLHQSSMSKSQLLVQFLNVGQGDCVLVQTPDGRNVLIDAGDANASDYVIRYLKHRNIQHIDVILITHTSSDDIGGLPNILKEFGVSKVIDAGCAHPSPIYQNVLADIKSRRIDYRVASGSKLHISNAVSFEIVWPTDDYRSNSESLAIRITYKDISTLLMGDTDPIAEGELLSVRQDLGSAILGVPLHGDKDAASNELLQVVQPDFAIISVGQNNPYDAPAQNTMNRLHATGAKILRTDRNGTIVFSTDGIHVQLVTER